MPAASCSTAWVTTGADRRADEALASEQPQTIKPVAATIRFRPYPCPGGACHSGGTLAAQPRRRIIA